MGAAPVAAIMCPRISREGAMKRHFSKLMARPLVAKAVKKASRWQRCVYLSRELARESSMHANHLWHGPSFVGRFVRRWTAQKVLTNIQIGQMAL
jgi:hypothetical protein